MVNVFNSFCVFDRHLDEFCGLSDLTGDSYTFGRGEGCDYQFDTSTAIKNPCYQAYSKTHFRITRVCLQSVLFCMYLVSLVLCPTFNAQKWVGKFDVVYLCMGLHLKVHPFGLDAQTHCMAVWNVASVMDSLFFNFNDWYELIFLYLLSVWFPLAELLFSVSVIFYLLLTP